MSVDHVEEIAGGGESMTGNAIVSSPSNFGHSGQTPANPELLDHLATRFIEHGGSIKKLVRDEIGAVAAFKTVMTVPRLPKTRSGKILRGTMRQIADGDVVIVGTGLPLLAATLAQRTHAPCLTILFEAGGIEAPGDLRRCLVALARDERSVLARAMEHRFEAGARRVVRPRIVEPAVHTGLVLFVGGRLEDGRDDRACSRIGRLSSVDADGGEARVRREFHALIFAHGAS